MSGDAATEKKEKGFLAHAGKWLALVCGVVALYVLSFGPALKLLCVPGMTPSPAIIAIYAPLGWVCKNCEIADILVSWYLQIVWGVYVRNYGP
jgi:hypothetical protein